MLNWIAGGVGLGISLFILGSIGEATAIKNNDRNRRFGWSIVTRIGLSAWLFVVIAAIAEIWVISNC
jgi:hypothetical protein